MNQDIKMIKRDMVNPYYMDYAIDNINAIKDIVDKRKQGNYNEPNVIKCVLAFDYFSAFEDNSIKVYGMYADVTFNEENDCLYIVPKIDLDKKTINDKMGQKMCFIYNEENMPQLYTFKCVPPMMDLKMLLGGVLDLSRKPDEQKGDIKYYDDL